MNDEVRLRRLERNYELLRTELMTVKKLAQEHRESSLRLDELRAAELHSLQEELEQLRIENARLRVELDEARTGAPTQ
jgi:regulator of replication initiation timing